MSTLPILSFLLVLLAQQAPEEARRERVMQWAVKADAASCASLEGALTDASSDIRNRAATAIYWKCDRAQAGAHAAKQLCRSADLGNASAGVFLLLGYGTKADSEPCLAKKRPAWTMGKLVSGSRPVPAAFAARVGLARLGNDAALLELRQAFAKNTVDEALFLLAALRDIEDPDALNGAIKMLDDARECAGVTSISKRHVRDVATDALVARFSLQPGTQAGNRYTPAQILQVREALQKKR